MEPRPLPIERMPVPEVETPDHLQILHNLRNPEGNLIGLQLVNDIENGPTDTVVIWGLPGSGKSLLARELSIELSRLGIKTDSVTFDQVYNESGFDPSRSSELTSGDLARLSLNLDIAIAKKREEIRNKTLVDGIKRVLIVDTMSVGIRDRGVSTLISLATTAKSEAGRCKFIGLTTHPKVHERAMKTRRLALNLDEKTSDEELERKLKEKLGINVVSQTDPNETARRLRSAVRKMSFPEENWFKQYTQAGIDKMTIDEVRAAQDTVWHPEFVELLVQVTDLIKRDIIKVDELNKFSVPPDIQNLSNIEIENFKLITTFFNYYSQFILGLDETESQIAVNPYLPQINWYLDPPEIREGPSEKGRVMFFILRHGEQEDYVETNSKLSDVGQIQMRRFGTRIANRFNSQSRKTNIEVWTSSRPRAIASGEEIEKEIDHLSIDSNIELLSGRVWETLQTADSLDVLIKDGIDPDLALEAWHTLPEKEIDAMSPGDVIEHIIKLVEYAKKVYKEYDKPDQHVYILVTHEPTLSALAEKLGADHTQISHGEYIEISLDSTLPDPVVFFRGKQHSLKV